MIFEETLERLKSDPTCGMCQADAWIIIKAGRLPKMRFFAYKYQDGKYEVLGRGIFGTVLKAYVVNTKTCVSSWVEN